MTPPKKRKLQLVPYEPDNYAPGEVLALDDATVLSSDKAIGSALSLYFQWEKKRSCHITFSKEAGALLCEMDYDHDEASPTEIRVQLSKISKKKSVKVVPGSTVLIRFEIFRVTYVFTSVITAVAADPKVEGWHSIIEVPSELRVLKTRHLPRLVLDDAGRAKLPKATWTSSSGDPIDLKLLEIGMGSVRASFIGEALLAREKSGKLSFGEALVPVEVVRSGKGEIILKLNFVDHKDFGPFWDYYRLVAYPSMRSRYEVPFEEGIELYEKTNYFGVYGAEKSSEEINELIKTWEDIRSGFHSTNADYYITDDHGVLSGSSSLVLTNFSQNESVWAFHQLCAIKNPYLVEQSGVLYTWRSEYLASHPEKLSVTGNFYSKSRWLERIYVKHTRNSMHGSKLWQVINRRCTFSRKDKVNSISLKSYPIGKIERISTTSDDIWGSANPKFLNANQNLDTIVAVFRPTTKHELENIGGNLAEKLNEDNISILATLLPNFDLTSLMSKEQRSDRFFRIPKDDLLLFMSSVEHSVAVTERKLLNAGVE